MAGAPPKMLLYCGVILEMIERAEEFDIAASVGGVAFADIVREVNEFQEMDFSGKLLMPCCGSLLGC